MKETKLQKALRELAEAKELLCRTLDYVERAYECAFPDLEANQQLEKEIKDFISE